MKKIFLSTLAIVCISYGFAAEDRVLTLDDCRSMAIQNNKELGMVDKQVQKAYYERKAAFTKYFPRVNATGGYIHTDKELSLISDEQKNSLGSLGTVVSSLVPGTESYSSIMNALGSNLVDNLRTDTRNMGAAAILLTQPIYMGGKIATYNQITKYAEAIAQNNYDLKLQDVILEVDEVYWRIVSLQTKLELAESYLKLIDKLDNDVQQMVEEGVATKADGLSVKVKLNEAKVTMIQVKNGLSISKMLLCQICGLPVETPIQLADSQPVIESDVITDSSQNVKLALNNRLELNSLDKAVNIAKEKVKLSRSEYLPNIALTGGYAASNPSMFNGFENKFKGMWNVGVVVNIPIITSGERIYKLKAAKADVMSAQLKYEETCEKVELQVNQNRQKVDEASERFVTARQSQEEADENLRYATMGMKEGVIPISNVLQAQTAWLSAHSEVVTANIDLRLAHLYLQKAIGSLNVKN